MNRTGESADVLKCSFCDKSQKQVKRLIAATGVYICNECVELCNEILVEEKQENHATNLSNLPKPKEVIEFLNQYIVGQDSAKRTLAVAVYNHYKRVNDLTRPNRSQDDEAVEIQKSNVLLIGPTGTGKTYLAQTLARMLDVPFAMADATSLTEAGYVGDDVENILLRLIQAADGDVSRAERGIIYIDEIDKINRKSENPSITRDVSGEGVQQALLKIIEGNKVGVPPQGGRKHPNQQLIQIDTTNVIFILGGAFVGLEEIIEKRLGRGGIGFGAQLKQRRKPADILPEVKPDDLHLYGMLPEFVGRLPVIATVADLDEPDLIKILTEPKNALVKQYQRIFALDGVELEVEEAALFEIAHQAMERKTGARGLRAIMEDAIRESMFEVPSRTDVEKVILTKAAVCGEGEPVVVINTNAKERA